MRKLYAGEIEQRGCHYCEKRQLRWDYRGGYYRSNCPYQRCPYRILDKFNTYEEFIKNYELNSRFLTG